jgi:tetratricopeptide (TPR) repeat protein
VWRALGRVREADGRPEAAEQAYRQGLEHQPRDAGLNALLGLLLARRGDGEAERHLKRALELSPEPLPEVHDGLAAVAAGRGDWPAMEAEARRAVELDPRLASGWNHLAVALEETGRPTDALAAYERALEVSPGYWQARFNLGLLLRRMGRWEAAEAAFRAVLERRPGHAGSHYELGVLYGGPLARPEEARRHLNAALEATRDPDQAEQIRRLLGSLGPGG